MHKKVFWGDIVLFKKQNFGASVNENILTGVFQWIDSNTKLYQNISQFVVTRTLSSSNNGYLKFIL